MSSALLRLSPVRGSGDEEWVWIESYLHAYSQVLRQVEQIATHLSLVHFIAVKVVVVFLHGCCVAGEEGFTSLMSALLVVHQEMG